MVGTSIVATSAFVFILFVLVLGGVAFFSYRRSLRRAKAIERGLKMVPIRIHLPPALEKEQSLHSNTEQMRQRLSQAETLYGLLAGSKRSGLHSTVYGQRHVSLEIMAADGAIHFYAGVPADLVAAVEQAIQSAYPGAKLEEVEDYNIFNEQGKIRGTVGGELVLKENYATPLQTYSELERDPLEALLNSLSHLSPGEGAAVQLLLRPAPKNWVKRLNRIARTRRRNPASTGNLDITPKELAKAAVKGPTHARPDNQVLTGIDEANIGAMEQKAKHPGFEVLVRILASAPNEARAQTIMGQMASSFALYEAPGRNGFRLVTAGNIEGLVTAFIFRFFPPELKGNILNTQELATIFHLPDMEVSTATTQVERQRFHEADGPVNLPTSGLLFGYNQFRGVKKEVRLDVNDRRRHTYIVGQTGTGKSTLLENLAVQDMLAGNGFAFIDPHGDVAERLLGMVPKARAEDIIYFNPGDTARPLGLNMFEFTSPEQKDFIIQETINMLYKLYDPGKTGIIGPRYEHWFRNAALTLMADPEGSTFIEIPKVFTDNEYLKNKFKYLNDQTVIEFWTKEMAQTSDYHKSEMLGWFVSKFGAFQSNEIMRNIIGQTKSAFNFRDIMDNKKILIVNLSKGLVGELNSNLLGMILVIKFQAAAMSRATMAEDQRQDFCLYVDEFQNFSTDSFATILSEARKYRLNLIVANQFIGQLSEQIRDAVFGNVGSVVSFRTGPEDADFLVKQFAPVFDAQDLVNIPNGHAAMRLMVGGLPSQPFSMNALPPLTIGKPELAEAVKQLSAAKFGAPKDQVAAEIQDRLSNKPAPPPKPATMPQSAATPAPPPAPAPDQPAVAQAAPTTAPPAAKPARPDTLDIKPKVPKQPAPQAPPVQAQASVASDQPSIEPKPVAAPSQPAVAQPAPKSQPDPGPDVQMSDRLRAKIDQAAREPMPANPATKPQAVQDVAQPSKPAPMPEQKPMAQPVQPAPVLPVHPEHKVQQRQRVQPQSASEQLITRPQQPQPAQPVPAQQTSQPRRERRLEPISAPTAAQSVQSQPKPQPQLSQPEPQQTTQVTNPEPPKPATPEPIKEAVAATPNLQPGQVHVDEHGNVTMG